MNYPGVTIAIESAIRSGSVSIFRGGDEIDYWIGSKAVSRAEDLLAEISRLLTKNQIEKNEIEMIAVSNQFGSFTGIRIGLSTALGISRSCKAFTQEVSLLASFAQFAPGPGQSIVAASGNNQTIYVQTFDRDADGENVEITKPCVLKIEEFYKLIETESPIVVISNDSLHRIVIEHNELPVKFVNVGNNLARLIAFEALRKRNSRQILSE